jgi:hypothetical protein
MALWLFFGVWRNRADANWPAWGGGLLVEFALFVLIGLRVFGSPVK